jgi:trk system potassium uptake protein TrkH
MIAALFPSLDIGGYRLFSSDKWLLSNTKLFILRISLIYFFLTVIQITVLYFEGIDLFNGLCYSFGTVSTGCFSPVETNVTLYSPLVQSTLAFFMFLSGISYLFYYRLVYKKLKLKKIHEEIKVYIILVVVGVLVVIAGMYEVHPVSSFWDTTRNALLQVISVVSSSGYFVSDYSIFPDLILTVLIFYLFAGGCSNTSTGGIKISRLIILFRNILQQFKSPDLSANVSSLTYNGCTIDTKTNLSVLTFICLFGATFLFGGIAMSFFGYGLKESAFLSISALSTFGHNLNLSHLPGFGKLMLTLLMLLGRLEIYPVILLFIPIFYKKDQFVQLGGIQHAKK